jgi:hypothetical protein
MPASLDQKQKALAEHWIGRFMIEKNLKSREDIDPVEFSLWIQSRERPSNGQKRNIASAIKKHFGIKLLAICSPPREVPEMVTPSRDTFIKTILVLDKIHKIKKMEDGDNYSSEYEMARFAFVSSSITGLSIAELSRSTISYPIIVQQDRNDDSVKVYDLEIIVNHPDYHDNTESIAKIINLTNLTVEYLHFIKNFINVINLNREYGFSQMVSKIQHIITRHNQAKGYNLRQLRKMYPEILGYIKSES